MQTPSEAPPVYPIPMPAPVPAYPLPVKDETPPYTTSGPPPPVPVHVAPVSVPHYRTAYNSSCTRLIYLSWVLVPASCAAGHHDPTTKFGTCGIITAIVSTAISFVDHRFNK